MVSLSKLQHNFISDCLSGELSDYNVSMGNDLNIDTISAKGRMGIYRESSVGNITVPLQLTYPVVQDLVGEDFFCGMCREYISGNWPLSGNMDDYGMEFTDFIAGFEPAKSLSYLPDIAKLEWLFHLSSLADDKDIGDWSGFAELSEDEIVKTIIDLHPSVQLMSSRYPLLKIWEMCKSEDDVDGFDIDKEGGDNVLLVRKDLRVNLYPIADNEIAFLRGLFAGRALVEAFDGALGIGSDEAMQDFIAKHIEIGTFCGYSSL